MFYLGPVGKLLAVNVPAGHSGKAQCVWYAMCSRHRLPVSTRLSSTELLIGGNSSYKYV